MRPGKRSGIKNDFYKRALKFEIALILFLLVCFLLVAGWGGKGRPINEQSVRASAKIQQELPPPDHHAQERQITAGAAIQGPQPQKSDAETEMGLASYYQDAFHGNLTASGERYDKHRLTAAHRQYPYGTSVRVTNLSNGKSVVVRINDRGPYENDRIIDVSGYAADVLDLVEMGIAKVRVEVVR
jgi:rare lipoprotein A